MTEQEVVERLEKGEGADRELDAEIVALLNDCIVKRYPPTDDFGPKATWQFWSNDGKHFIGSDSHSPTSKFFVPKLTASLDAAISLVEKMLPGCDWHIDRNKLGFGAFIGPVDEFHATSAARALLLALLRTIAKEK